MWLGKLSNLLIVACLKATHPAVAAWLEPLGPLRNEARLAYRAVTKVLRKSRARVEQRFRATCRFV